MMKCTNDSLSYDYYDMPTSADMEKLVLWIEYVHIYIIVCIDMFINMNNIHTHIYALLHTYRHTRAHTCYTCV